MKQIFFKTVREDYSSVYARGKLSKTYKIGEHYTFPEVLPAHVFPYCKGISQGGAGIDFDFVYNSRKEVAAGNRVLICYGEVVRREVPCFDICDDSWNLNKIFSGNFYDKEQRETSVDFDVIGEIALPRGYYGKRPLEYPKGTERIVCSKDTWSKIKNS